MSDERLKQLFGAMNQDLPALEFKEQVLRRIERADRIRYVVLTAAAALGLAIAAGPLWDLLLLGARELLAAIVTLREADLSLDPAVVAVVLLLGVLPGVVRWLER
jgi:hypothetical protein